MALHPLPIDPWIPEIVARVRESRAAIVTAAPGAGKTTRLPPALLIDGPVIVLQPRRVAARSMARRIATEQGWTIGAEIGWHVRFERQFGPQTRLLLATEGILTARLQQDPLLSGFRTIVLDEFHERSIHADLGIALAKQAWLARDDLRIVVMSATMETAPVAEYLGGCPVFEVTGRTYPLDISYHPNVSLGNAVGAVVASTPGQVLCFLPGAAEIRRAAGEIGAAVGSLIEIVPLHGSLDPAEQDRAIAAASQRRVILATNIAETSLTVPGVSAVIDSGVEKVARYDSDRAIDSLDTERISRDSADQRAGRAARVGPGRVWRLWHQADRLRPHREPDIHRTDLSGPLLDILAWGGDPRRMDWFDPPHADALDAGLELLERLGAVERGTLTSVGRHMQRIPIHPRLARILIAAGGTRQSALACALLAERRFVPPSTATTASDLLSAIEQERELPPHVLRVAQELIRAGSDPQTTDVRLKPDVTNGVDRGSGETTQAAVRSARDPVTPRFSQTNSVSAQESSFRRALLYGYPDRVGKRRVPGSQRVLLASGHGAALAAESGVRDGEYLVALDVQSGRRGEASEARIRLASIVDREWLKPTESRVDHELDAASGVVRAWSREYYGEVVLTEHSVRPDPGHAAALLAAAFMDRDMRPGDERLLRRLRFAGLDPDLRQLVTAASQGCRSLAEIDLTREMSWQMRQDLERLAPESLLVPSGRSHLLDYQADGSVLATVKLQEMFGLADTPRIGARAEPVLLVLVAPNGRPVQMTRDLRSFWERTYPDVRKELRGRYPKHPWPEDPWTAAPTARTTGRKRS